MQTAQDWCLQCGAGAPGSLPEHTPGWRSGATILLATAVLALGAAAAAYAALSHNKGATIALTRTIEHSTLPAASPPGLPTIPGGLTPASAKNLGIPTTIKHFFGLRTAKPPKIPLTAERPEVSPATAPPFPPAATSPSRTPSPKTSTPPTSGRPAASSEPQPQAILLDTNAATTYNPYGYPASNFGDPSLAIDGEPLTAWTAQADPAVAPKMAEGLAIDLKTPETLSALELETSTPGMAVQVYASNSQPLPASITAHGWVELSPAQIVKAKRVRIKLEARKPFRFLTVWISRAPAAPASAPQAPGQVSINELELFP